MEGEKEREEEEEEVDVGGAAAKHEKEEEGISILNAGFMLSKKGRVHTSICPPIVCW